MYMSQPNRASFLLLHLRLMLLLLSLRLPLYQYEYALLQQCCLCVCLLVVCCGSLKFPRLCIGIAYFPCLQVSRVGFSYIIQALRSAGG